METSGLADIMGAATPALLDAFLESIADGVYVVDPGGDVLYANRAALEVLGYAAEAELLGRPSHATIHHTRPDGSPFPEAECPLLRPRTTGETVQVHDDWFVRADGSMVPVAYSSSPVATAQGRGAVVVFRDVSGRRELEELHEREALARGRAEEARASRARVVAATDAERRRLGRDLHDGAQQRLTNVVLALQLALAASGEDALREQVAAALDETQRAIRELRAFAAGLHPTVLTTRGLAAAVHGLTARTPLPVTVDIPEARVEPALEATAYFIVAEALANVAKHADATEASVTASLTPTALTLEIADDGRGGAEPGGGGSGLVGLADRVAAHDGTLAVDSPPGGGTRVRAVLLRPPAGA